MNVGGSARIRGLVVNEDESCRPVTDVQVPKKLRLPQPSSNSISFRAFLGFRQRMPTRPYYVYPSICLFGRLSVCLCFCHRDVLSPWKVCIIFWQTLALIIYLLQAKLLIYFCSWLYIWNPNRNKWEKLKGKSKRVVIHTRNLYFGVFSFCSIVKKP